MRSTLPVSLTTVKSVLIIGSIDPAKKYSTCYTFFFNLPDSAILGNSFWSQPKE